MKDELRIFKNKLEDFCNHNSIYLFQGEADCSQTVNWRGKSEKDLENFLQVLVHFKVKIITAEFLEDEYNVACLEDAYEIFKKDEEQLKVFQRCVKLAKEVKGMISSMTISFLQEGVLYCYESEASWKEELENIMAELGLDDEEEESDQPYSHPIITEEQVEEKARMILGYKEYQDAPDPFKRNAVLKKLWDKLEGWENRPLFDRVLSRTEELFKVAIYPKKEAELREKIEKCKRAGLNQVATKARLGITKGQLDRHWHTIEI